MRVLLTQEWKVQRRPYHGMLKLKSLTERAYLIVDTVKLYDKEKGMAFIYSVNDGKILKQAANRTQIKQS